MLTILHAADLHLDSPFRSLPPREAQARRADQRKTLEQLRDLALEHRVDLVLLAGDLFDSQEVYPETLEALARVLGQLPCPVVIAPGNHDYYGTNSPYSRPIWPENVRIFTSEAVSSFSFPELETVVYGCAFTSPYREDDPLAGFSAPKNGGISLGIYHADVAKQSRYAPIAPESLERSGLDYVALGHVHARSGLQGGGPAEGRGTSVLTPSGPQAQEQVTSVHAPSGLQGGGPAEGRGTSVLTPSGPQAEEQVTSVHARSGLQGGGPAEGRGISVLTPSGPQAEEQVTSVHAPSGLRGEGTYWAYPGCPQGRGFDELGDRGVYLVQVSGQGQVELEFVPLAGPRYRELEADLTGREAAGAVREALADCENDYVRLTLTGEAADLDLSALRGLGEGLCRVLELRDETARPRNVWERMNEDTLTGHFLREMAARLEAATAEERGLVEAALRYGLAALEGREEPR